MKYWAITILIFFLFGLTASKVSASGILFKDDFSENTLSNWHTVRNQQLKKLSQPCLLGDQKSDWLITGQKAEMNISGPQCTTELIPRFLDLTNVKEYQLDLDMTMKGTVYADRYLMFSWHDEKNWYDIHFYAQTIIFEKVINNTHETLENSFRYPLDTNQTYHFTIIFKNQSEIIFKINNEAVLTFNDSFGTFSGFKTIGLQAGVFISPDSDTLFDNVVVSSLDPGIDLGIPVLKQNDPLWGEEEYDSAKLWSSKTGITAWGCSLTSMVMILHYYDIYFLPDETFLTPSSLNTWLKSQADGYVGDGALNWLAVTRLTKEIHTKFQTPNLEFKRLPGNLELAKTEIKQQRPVIISIPGHFLVGDGVTEDDQNILIKDPYFPYLLFNEHKKEPLAINTFTPSFTDLSYFLLAHRPGLNIHLINAEGKDVPDFTEFREHVESSTLSSPITAQHLLPKPNDGIYILQVSANSPSKYSLQFFTYDSDGNATDLSVANYFTNEPKYYVINYAKNRAATIELNTDFSTFRSDLFIGKTLKQLKTETIFTVLDEEASYAEFSGQIRQKRYLLQLTSLLENLQDEMTLELKEILKNDLNSISRRLDGIISR